MSDVIDFRTGELLEVNEPADLPLFETYGPTPLAVEEPRLDWLATISAGFRQVGEGDRPGLPTVSRDGTIYLHDPHGRAPGLARALAATGAKRLTIAFPFNNPAAFVQQRFTEYSATSLLAYGDEYSMTVLEPKTGRRAVFEVGSPEYDAARARCKLAISIYFSLAEWTADGPRVVWPDGLGLYRIRTTSRNSQRSLRAAIRHVQAFTGGQLAGVPFDLALDYRDVADPTGARRTVPVWTFTMAPPGGLTSRTFAPTLRDALREGRLLQIAPPDAETAAGAEADYQAMGDDDAELPTPPEPEVALVAAGGRCDARAAEARWFALVKGTALDSDAARAAFMVAYSGGETSSLAEYLQGCSEAGVDLLLETAAKEIAAEPRGPDFLPATEDQIRALRRLLRPSQQQEVDWEALSYRDAADWIQSAQR